jgi:hypothetical protein
MAPTANNNPYIGEKKATKEINNVFKTITILNSGIFIIL